LVAWLIIEEAFEAEAQEQLGREYQGAANRRGTQTVSGTASSIPPKVVSTTGARPRGWRGAFRAALSGRIDPSRLRIKRKTVRRNG